MAPPRKSRLDHFLEAYRPIDQDVERRLWDRVHRAGWSQDDPVSLQIAFQAIEEARMAAIAARMDALPDQMAEAARVTLNQIEKARARTTAAEREAIAAHVAQEAGDVLRASMPRLERQFQWRVATRLIATAALIALVASGAGYILGRHDTAALDSRYADLAEQPDAETWQTLQEVNPNLDEVISDQCRPGQQDHIATASGRKACAVPLWLEGDVVRLPTGFVGRTREHLTSLQARLPFGAVLTIGVLLGISISPPLRRLKRWLKTGEG